jgi:coproporphyrinogen III oxidase-like Fe-S oxidoreductase
MIFNVPRQTPEILERDLDTIQSLGVDQVSFYPLMSATEVRRKMALHMGSLDRRRQHDYYERIRTRLASTYRPSSAWCFDRGAQAIDEYIVGAGDYVGVGSGAFSYVNGTMYATTFSLNHYAQLAGSGQPAITKTRHLAPRERMRYEFLIRMFGMSMDRAWMERRFDGEFARTLRPELAAFRLLGAVREDERGWHLTERGMYLWVLMMSSFFEGVNQFRAEMRASIREELG